MPIDDADAVDDAVEEYAQLHFRNDPPRFSPQSSCPEINTISRHPSYPAYSSRQLRYTFRDWLIKPMRRREDSGMAPHRDKERGIHKNPLAGHATREKPAHLRLRAR
jgi:hypothetical protein